MNDSFNPYFEWLGIDRKIAQPNFYQLLELEPFESDPEKISSAADKATTRVRSFRPGANAPHWAKLLDEIGTARRTFASPTEKENYDNQLRTANAEKAAATDASKNDRGRSADLAFIQANTEGRSNFYPPGFSTGVTAPTPTPSAPVSTTPTPVATTSNAADIAATPSTSPLSPTPSNVPPSPAPASNAGTPAWNPPASNAYYPPGMSPALPAAPTASNPMSPFGSPGGASAPAAMNPTTMYGNPMAGNPMAGNPMAAAPMPSAPMASYAQPGATNPPGTVILPPHANPLVHNPMGTSPFANPVAAPMSPFGSAPAPNAHMAPNPMAPAGYPSHGGPLPGNAMARGPMAGNPMSPMGGGYGAHPAGGMSANPMAPAYASPGPMSPNAIPTASLAANPMNPMMSANPYAMPASMPGQMSHAVPGLPPMNQTAPLASMPGNVPMAQLVQAPPGANVQVALGIPVGGPMPSNTAPMQQMSSGPLLSASPVSPFASPNSPTASPMTPASPMIRSQSTSSKLRGERSQSAVQMPIILGVGGGMVMLTFAVIFYAMGGSPTRDEQRDLASNANDKHNHSHSTHVDKSEDHGHSSTKVNPPSQPSVIPPMKGPMKNGSPSADIPDNDPTMTSKSPVLPKPTPKPPDPTVTLKPQPPVVPPPTPTPTPVPTPTPTPPPPPPPPTKKPKREEVEELAKALKQAHLELSELNVADAEKTLQKVEKLTMLPEHAEKLERLKQLVHYNHEFLRAMREASKGFQPGATIQIGNTVAAIVETFTNQDKIILRIAGMNRTYLYREMPVGLAVAVANEWLDKKASSSLVVKACFVMTSKKSNDEMHKKAHEWLNEAKRDLADVVSTVEAAVVDNYDLMKDFKD